MRKKGKLRTTFPAVSPQPFLLLQLLPSFYKERTPEWMEDFILKSCLNELALMALPTVSERREQK